MPSNLPAKGEGPGTAPWLQPIRGGWHGSRPHERAKGWGGHRAIELYKLLFINRPHRSAKSRQCLLVGNSMILLPCAASKEPGRKAV